MNKYNFYHIFPENKFYGGVGIYVHNSIYYVYWMHELKIVKSCHCPRYENESIFLKFTYCRKKLAGDINIDIIKYNNEKTVQYLTTLLSCRFLPYITLPTRITEYSATYIDHICVKLSKMLYCDITDHLPCFVSLKCIDYINMNERPNVRLHEDRNCERFVEMMTTKQWDSLYTENVDGYTSCFY